MERRRPQVTDDLSYFFYPLAYQVPGLGAGQGLRGTVINGLGSGSTIRACQQFSRMTEATQWIAPRKAQSR